MSNIKTVLILYPNQLFDTKLLPAADVIFVVEDPLFFGLHPKRQLNFHKQKLVFHRSTMRRYVEELLWQQDLNVEYIELGDIKNSGDVLIKAQKLGAQQVIVFDICDRILESELKETIDNSIDNPFELKVLPSPSFMLKSTELKDYFSKSKDTHFKNFYQWQRERFNILIDKNYKPTGGKWLFETKENSTLPDTKVSPGFKAYGDNQYVKQAIHWVEKHFSANPGSLNNFFWPTDHSEAKQWLQDFLKNRFYNFASYADTLDNNSILLYHSAISALLNSGLLTPSQVINETLAYASKNSIDITNLETFIRKVIGYREFVRGLYITNSVNVPKEKLSLGKQLSSKWYDGSTGLPPLDDTIHKVIAHGYLGYNERLMVVGNLMLLTGVNALEMYKWYMSLFIDAYDWAVQPNVFGVYNLDDLGGMVKQHYISDSSYVLSESDYKKELWCDIWDGLFWDYVDKHRVKLANLASTAHTVKNLSRITPEHQRIINYRAQDFLASLN